jgi:1,2-diacylglycerol 3-beta-glucosyltransferase
LLSNFVAVFQTTLLLIFAVPVLYLLFLMVVAAFYRRPSLQPDSTNQTFNYVILVPAHDEALTLPAVLPSIKALRSSPTGQAPMVIVIADNCSDNTADLARQAGVQVWERQDVDRRGKGYALEWAIGRLIQEYGPDRFNALVVLDADSLPDNNFLQEVDYSLRCGAQVLQGRYDILKQHSTWRTHLLSTAFIIYNHVRPLGRAALNLSDGLRGNGMVFRREVLEELPWRCYGLVEDIEYANRLVLAGKKVTYAPQARLSGQGAGLRKQATVQRMRWEGGRFRQARKDIPGLLRYAVTKLSFSALDRALDLLIPPLAMLALFLGGFAALNAVLWLALGGSWLEVTLLGWAGLITGLMVFVVGGLLVGQAPRAAWAALAFAPFYIIWKLYIYGLMLVRRIPTEWVRTPRTIIDVKELPVVVESEKEG